VRRGGRAVLLACAALAAPATAAGAGWDAYPGVLDEYATVRAAGIERDGTARVLYASQDPTQEPGPLRFLGVMRPAGGPWTAPASWSPPLPDRATIYEGPNGHLAAVGRTPGGAPAVVLGRGAAWAPPVALAAARAVVNGRGAALLTLGGPTRFRAAVLDPASGLRPVGAGAPANQLSLRATEDPPDMALNDTGDAVVAWVRGEGRGLDRVLEANVYHAGDGWSGPANLSGRPSRISGFAVAIDPQGTAMVLWGQGGQPLDGKRENPLRDQRIRVAERAAGARSWAPAQDLARGEIGSPYVGVDGAGTALAAWDFNPVVTAVRAHGGPWRLAAAPPDARCCIERLAVSPLGDAFLVSPSTGSAEGVWRRPAGPGRWERAPDGLAPSVMNALFPYRLQVNAAGDALLTWDDFRSNSSAPVGAAVYEAPPRPGIASFSTPRARVPDAGRLRFLLQLSAAGRVIVTVRRPGGVRPLAAFIVTAPARRVGTRIPPAALPALSGRGRYVVEADTGARDAARAARRVTVVVTG
jgi:hypothetical protein